MKVLFLVGATSLALHWDLVQIGLLRAESDKGENWEPLQILLVA